MSQQPSGWYDDPSDPDLLRYWDGVMWTSHTAPRKSPTASQSTIGRAQQAEPVAPRAPQQGGPPAATTPVPTQGGAAGPWGQSAPAYPQAPANANWMHDLATTTDGVPLASWGKRLLAWILDGIVILIIAGIITQVAVPDYSRVTEDLLNALESGSSAQFQQILLDATGTFAVVGIISYLVASVYAVFFWTRTGQTFGKMAAGISVRRVDRPGPLDLTTAVKRRLLQLVSIIPGISSIYGILGLLDGLWPLWDDKRQTLHDKIAGTQVVRGKQPRRQG